MTPPDESKFADHTRQVRVTETIFGDPYDTKRYHLFPLPIAIGGGYRQVLSYNAFFHSCGSHYRNWTDQRLFHAAIIGVDPIYADIYADTAGPPLSYPDIYAFFLAIGYDYHHKRYTNGERLKKCPSP
jgi:hypothetical protein